MRAVLVLLAVLSVTLARPAHARSHVNHGAAAIGGGVAGLVCGGGTFTYATLRAGAEGKDPLAFHQGSGPGWIGIFFAEHAAAGGLTGAFGDGPREGFVIGGAVTCTLDLVWIVASEVIARGDEEPTMGALERSKGRWRFGVPPVAVEPKGVRATLFAWRF